MDAVRPPGSTAYNWPKEILAALRIGKPDIGLVAAAQHPAGQVNREIYLPVSVSQQRSNTRSGPYQVTVMAGEELSEMFLTLALDGPDGRPASYLLKDESLKRGYYPAEKPVSVTLPELKKSGIYSLEIGAASRRGGSASETIWLYHK